MDKLLTKLALAADKSFSSEIDFSNKTPLAKASLKVLDYLYKFKIGPAVLSLLIVFAFPKKSREKIWKEINKAVKENR